MKKRAATKFAVAAWVVAGVACAPGRAYHDQNMDFGSIHSVAVLPFANFSRDNAAGEIVRDVFSNALLATGSVYVLPAGEVFRAVNRAGVVVPGSPSIEEVVKLGGMLKADAVITGVVKEFGEVRSGGGAVAPVISVSLQMLETGTGKVVWTGSSTRGGVSVVDRLLGSGGSPINPVVEQVADDLLRQLFD